MIRVEFDTDNAAFDNDLGVEADRILCDAGRRIAAGASIGPLLDINGNKVGFFEVLLSQRMAPSWASMQEEEM
jgi:hypothetical protein